MIQFIKDALTELEHIVWPTPTESKKYMIYTVGTIIVLGVFLAVVGYALRSGLVFIRSQFPHTPLTEQTVSGESSGSVDDVQKVLDSVGIDNESAEVILSTGALTPDTTASGIAQ